MVLTEAGQIILVELDPEKYSEIDRFNAVSGLCWNVPAFADGRLYVRSTRQAAAYELGATLPPSGPLKLSARFSMLNQTFTLNIAAEDGAPLHESRIENVQVFTTTNLQTQPASWQRLETPLSLTNGLFQVEDPSSPSLNRFYRTEETP
jgi:hypothetical protein